MRKQATMRESAEATNYKISTAKQQVVQSSDTENKISAYLKK